MNRKAFALSIVLWIVAAMLFGIASLGLLSKNVMFLTKGVDQKLKSQLIAQDVLENLKFYILTADYDSISFKNTKQKTTKFKLPSRLIVDNRPYKIGEHIEIKLQDVSSLINVMYSSPKLIASLATTIMQRQQAYIITDSIMDWRDKDNVVRLNGAEASRYKFEKEKIFKPRNSNAVQSVDELRLIRGIDDLSLEKWEELKKRFYSGNGATVNLALIDSTYLASLLKMNLSQAKSLVRSREDDLLKFMNLTRNNKSFADENMGFALSKMLLIEITVTDDTVVSRLNTLIDFQESPDKLYTTVIYKLN